MSIDRHGVDAADQYGVRDLNAPWYSGIPTFARAPLVRPTEVPDGHVAVVGIPVDEYATSSQRSGMRWGPRRIREASLRWVRTQASVPDGQSLSMYSGAITTVRQPMPIVDTGDAQVVHHDPAEQVAAIAEHVRAATLTSGLTVSLGGDHFVGYPAALGAVQAWRDQHEGLKVGFLQLDAHTDFLDARRGTGRFHHGTFTRRVSEIPEVANIVWFGISTGVDTDQYVTMRDRGYRVLTAEYVHRVGAAAAMDRAIELALDGVDRLYVSIDIDVVHNGEAPATGSYVFEGITARQLLTAVRRLADVDQLGAIDLCEVAPDLDGGPSRRTELLAASTLYAIFGHRLLDKVGSIPADDMARVFDV